LKADNRCCTDI